MKNVETEWVLCSEDWRDIVITYVPELNDIPIENNYADISWEEIMKAYKMIQEKSTDEENKMIAYLKFILEFCTKYIVPNIGLKSMNLSI